MDDPIDRTLAIVLAGGPGSRLSVLTDKRAKPAMPFAGTFRLVDFPLSNCRHSRIPEVWVVEQYEPHSLVDHLSNGRPWDLDRSRGGLKMMHPHKGTSGEGFHEGTADAVAKLREFIEEQGAETLLVLSSDQVYRLDYRDVVHRHVGEGADLTIVTAEVEREDPGRFGVVEVDGDRITGFVRKPDDPPSRTVSTEVFCFRVGALFDALADVEADLEEAEDLGDALIPHLVEHADVRAFPLAGYWRDVGTLSSYLQGHRDLLGDDPLLDLSEWDVLSRERARPAAYVGAGAEVVDSLLAPGSEVHGTVRRSVVGPGVVVEDGAEVVDAVLLDDAWIGAGASVRLAVIDEADVGEDAVVGGDAELDDDTVTLVGRGASIADGAEVPVGARVAPGERVR